MGRPNIQTWLRTVLLATACLLLLLLPAPARADGGYVPVEASEPPPRIPYQTALIHWRGGEETLFVESAFQGAGSSEYAWILPLPAAPTRIEAASPELLGSLRSTFRREVVADSGLSVFGAFAVFWLFLYSAGLSEAVRKPGRASTYLREKLVEALIIFGIIGLLAAMSVSSPMSSTARDVDVLRSQRVGSYQTDVVQARAVEDLDRWLTKSGYPPLQPAVRTVVTQYIADGWVFAISRLRRAAVGETLVPHPLAVTFPAAQPIFPMRLTAISGRPTNVALFVLAQGPWKHPLLDTKVTDQLVPTTEYRTDWSSDRGVSRPALLGKSFGRDLLTLNQEFVPLAEDRGDYWITRLEATLGPGSMAQDIILQEDSRAARRETVYTKRIAQFRALVLALFIYTLILPFAAYMARDHEATDRQALSFYGGFLVLALACGAGWFFSVTKITDYRTDIAHQNQRKQESLIRRIAEIFPRGTAPAGFTAGEPAARYFRERLAQSKLVTSGWLTEGSQAGQYQIRPDVAGVPHFYFMDDTGYVNKLDIPKFLTEPR